MRKRVIKSVVVAALGLVPALALAVPPSTMVDGALVSASGGPAADGGYAVVFSLYKDANAPTAAWQEGPVTLTVKNGLFTYALGSTKPLDAAVLASLGATPHVGVKVEQDPELPRKPLLSVPFGLRAGVAEALDCSGCITAAHLAAGALPDLSGYAKTGALAKVATSGNYTDLQGTPDLGVFAKIANLATVASSGSYADLQGTPDLSLYAKVGALASVALTGKYTDLAGTPSLANVATTGNFADLAVKPVVPKVGTACGTGLMVKGLKADGSLDCANPMDPKSMPPDGLDEVSNGLLSNQFVDSMAGKANYAIKDNNPDGVTDTIAFPDIGVAQALSVQLDLVNSDLSTLRISLFDPENVEYVLCSSVSGQTSCGKKGDALNTSFPDKTKLSTGDLGTWTGKNPKGPWKLVVTDLGFKDNITDGQVNKWSISIQTLSNKKVQVKGALIVDNTLTVGGDVNVAGTLTANGQAVASNFKYVFINNDFRNNSSTVSAGNWADIPGRKLTYVKTRDASLLRVTYQDTLGTYGTDYAQCRWRILVDGNEIAYFSDADISYGLAWRMANAAHQGLGVGYKAGSHTITVQTWRSATECLMGWNTTNNFLAVEEVGP